MASSPSELAETLRRAGLNEARAIAGFGGATGVHAARLAGRAAPLPPTPAAAALELLVAGRSIDRAGAAALPVDGLLEAGLIAAAGDRLEPLARVIPHRERLLVCPPDQLPDDSSFHLLGALPRRPVDRWLDVGTGCGFAPLLAPRLAAERRGTDVDPGAIAAARIGARLCGQATLELAVADLFDGIAGAFDLISFNAPLPLPGSLADRFWDGAGAHLARGGEVLVHATGPIPALPGELTVARYTPAASPVSFAVARWRPGGPAGRREIEVELTVEHPHISRAVFDRC